MKHSLTILGLVLVLAAPAAAQERTPLAQVPGTWPVVVHLRGVDRTRQRTLTMLKRILPREGLEALKELETNLDDALDGKTFMGRSLKGVDRNGSLFLCMAELPTDPNDIPDSLVLVVPIKDYAAFRDGLLTEDERADLVTREGYDRASLMDKSVFFVNGGKVAYITLNRNLARRLTKPIAGLDARLDADTARQLLAADLAIYADPVALGNTYGDQLLFLRDKVEEKLLEKDGPLGDSEEMRETVKLLVKGVTQFCKDSRAVLLTAQAEPNGLKLHGHISIGRTTQTSRVLAGAEPTPLKEIGDLPAKQASFVAGRPLGGEGARDINTAFTRIFSKRSGLEAAAKLELEAGVDLILGANRDRFGTEGIQIKTCKFPQKLVQSSLKNFQHLHEGDPVEGDLFLAEKPDVKENAETYRGFTFHRARLLYDLEKSSQATPYDAAFLRRQLGGDEGTLWFGTDGKVYVELKGRTWANARQQLDAYLDRGSDLLNRNPGFLASRQQLPEKTSFLFLEETTIYSQLIVDLMQAKEKKFAQRIPREKPGQQAYWGWAATLRADQVGFDVWVDGKVFRDVFKGLGMGANDL